MKFQYKDSCLISENDIKKTADTLSSYVDHINEVVRKANYDDLESTINLPSDQHLLDAITKMIQSKVSPKLKYIIDIGIGGSNLGTKAIYDSFYGFFDMLEPERYPKMIFADTNDPEFLSKLTNFINTYINSAEEILVNGISKSGGTTETIANLEIILQTLEKKFPNGKQRLVITTDEGSKLMNQARKLGVDVLTMPKTVGGRYSVLSAVGLFPLAACGFDIVSLRKGAEQMRLQCLTKELSNPALVSAVILYLQKQNGKTINDNFIFHSELESIGKWYRQLMGESIGKEHDLNQNVVHTGITPTVSVGSTDLHSVGQLYFGGPRDKMTTLISTSQVRSNVSVPEALQFPLVNNIEGKKASEIMNAILGGVKAAYKNQKLPFMEVVLDDISEKSLGEFLQFKMIEMMYLGKLLNINTFDQPHVELYKVETKKILSQVSV